VKQPQTPAIVVSDESPLAPVSLVRVALPFILGYGSGFALTILTGHGNTASIVLLVVLTLGTVAGIWGMWRASRKSRATRRRIVVDLRARTVCFQNFSFSRRWRVDTPRIPEVIVGFDEIRGVEAGRFAGGQFRVHTTRGMADIGGAFSNFEEIVGAIAGAVEGRPPPVTRSGRFEAAIVWALLLGTIILLLVGWWLGWLDVVFDMAEGRR
jgi:hypothetical protein